MGISVDSWNQRGKSDQHILSLNMWALASDRPPKSGQLSSLNLTSSQDTPASAPAQSTAPCPQAASKSQEALPRQHAGALLQGQAKGTELPLDMFPVQ